MDQKRREFIDIILKKANELGRTPKFKELKERGKIKRYFGTWNNAIKAAGFETTRNPKIYTEEEYVKEIEKWIKKNNKLPRVTDWDNDASVPCRRSIERSFGMPWGKLLKYLGYNSDINVGFQSKYMALEEIKEVLKSQIEVIGPINSREFDKLRNKAICPNSEHICEKFGMSWYRVLIDIGVDENKIRNLQRTKEEWIAKIQNLAKDLNRTPSVTDCENNGIIANILIDKFGSFNKAIKLAGLDPNHTPIKVTETDDELLLMYIEFSNKLKKPTTAEELNKSGDIYNAGVFIIRFGGMSELKRRAGYIEKTWVGKYSKKELIEILINLYSKNGRRLTQKEMRHEPNIPAAATFMKYFETTKMNEIWAEIETLLKIK